MTKPEGLKKYQPAFKLLKNWIDGNLDIYKVSLAMQL